LIGKHPPAIFQLKEYIRRYKDLSEKNSITWSPKQTLIGSHPSAMFQMRGYIRGFEDLSEKSNLMGEKCPNEKKEEAGENRIPKLLLSKNPYCKSI
jgi:hypothetical protein